MLEKINKSYGIICKNRDEFIMIQRLNSIEYFNIITGKYRNLEELEVYLHCITTKEWENFKKFKTFEEAWLDLWGNNRVKSVISQKQKFEYIHKILNFSNIDRYIHLDNTGLSFPKGKKISESETDLKCALREFTEETGISQKSIELTDKTYIHDYKGSDMNHYTIKYFVANLKDNLDTDRLMYDKYEVSKVVSLRLKDCITMTLNRNTRDLLYKL